MRPSQYKNQHKAVPPSSTATTTQTQSNRQRRPSTQIGAGAFSLRTDLGRGGQQELGWQRGFTGSERGGGRVSVVDPHVCVGQNAGPRGCKHQILEDTHTHKVYK